MYFVSYCFKDYRGEGADEYEGYCNMYYSTNNLFPDMEEVELQCFYSQGLKYDEEECFVNILNLIETNPCNKIALSQIKNREKRVIERKLDHDYFGIKKEDK